MSCQENDKIWERALDRARDEDLDEVAISEMDLEDAFDYLMTGNLPDSYHYIIYRLYKI